MSIDLRDQSLILPLRGRAYKHFRKSTIFAVPARGRDLPLRHGKGFSRSNSIRIRQFYLAFPPGAKASHRLSWSQYVEFRQIEDPLERSFYEQQAIHEKWAVRELQRQKKTSLFLRLAAGKDKKAILQLASQGQIIAPPGDILPDPFVLSPCSRGYTATFTSA